MSVWYNEKGPEADVVVSSRVRLARNFKNYPFPTKMNQEDEIKVVEESRDAVLNSKSPVSKEFYFIDLSKQNLLEKQSLVEKHVMSPEMVSKTGAAGLLVSRDEKVSIMVNEEDHLRIQCIFPGFQLDKAFDLGNTIDNLIEEKIEYAYSEKFGYLTCCPSNLGTGMRASVMMHLPGLTMTGYISGILEAVGKIGIAVRGLYGENSEATGNMFQVSNQVTLGQSESEILSNLYGIIGQIAERERSIRNELYKQTTLKFEDRIYRSYGLFSNARILSGDECMKLISDIRLGIYMGIIKNISIETLNELMVTTQPANLQKTAGRLLNPEERDIMRAKLIRERLHEEE